MLPSLLMASVFVLLMCGDLGVMGGFCCGSGQLSAVGELATVKSVVESSPCSVLVDWFLDVSGVVVLVLHCGLFFLCHADLAP